jgi:tetratricopeptide (TPR) repeat protein
MFDERITVSPVAVATSAPDAEWYVIRAGKEVGPLSLAELVGKAAIGQINGDDLVKQADGLWTKARDLGFLQQQFILKHSTEEAKQAALGNLFPFLGTWAYQNQKALVFGGCLLLALVVFAARWALSESTNPAQEAHNRGNTWLEKKEYEKAIKDYDEAIRLNAKDASAFLHRATAWLGKEDYDEAIKDFDEAIRLDPNNGLSYSGRGNAWYCKKEYEKAIKDYDKAIRLDPDDVLAFENRGNAWYCKKDYDKAIKDYDKAIRLNPNCAVAYFNRGMTWYDKDENDRAIKDFDEAIRLDPKDAKSFLYRSYAWYVKKDNDKSMKDFAEACRLNPNYADPSFKPGNRWTEVFKATNNR